MYSKEIIINNQKMTISLTEKEYKDIHAYIDKANRLNNILDNNKEIFKNINFSINYKKDTTNEIKVSNLNEEYKSILLHNLRPFILQNEKTYFNKICNLLKKNINEITVRKYIKNEQNFFAVKKDYRTINLTTEENKIITNEKTLDLWLNSYEYHQNEDKEKEIKDLIDFIPYEIFEFFMIQILMSKVKNIITIFKLCDNIFNKEYKKLDISEG